MRTLSLIVPVLDEAALIGNALESLAVLRDRGADVIVVDGGSRDDTEAIARPLADQIIAAPRGRGSQMNAGAAMARGTVLLFLHVDTALPGDADLLVLEGLRQSGRMWGRFDVEIAGKSPLLRLVARMMNLRSRLTGIATGDQAMFVTRAAFAQAGGFPDIALMEDIALSARLKRLGKPLCIGARVTTSARRFEQHGVIKTIAAMWMLRLAYYFGAEPAALAKRYGYAARKT